MPSMKRTLAGLAALPLLAPLAACSSGDEPAPKEPKAEATATYAVTMIKPVKEGKYLAGIRKRFDADAEVGDAEFLRWGKRSCELADGHAYGAGPSLGDLLTAEVAKSGWADEYAGDIATAAANAADGTLCTKALEAK